jgi:putative ABC transport system permease protein
MLLKEVILQAAAAIRDHRFRAGLTMLGIAWGIVTVVILMAYGQGFRSALLVGFRNAVSDGTARLRGGQTSSQVGGERAGRRIVLKDDDVEALRQLGTVKYASPEYLQSLPIVYGTRSTTAGVRGVSPEYAVMRSEKAGDGRFGAQGLRQAPAWRSSVRRRGEAVQQHHRS